MTSSNDEKIHRFIEGVRKRIRCFEESPRTLKDSVSHRLDVVLHKCGYKRRSQKIVEKLQKAFEAHGVFPQPQIDDMSLDFRQNIYFSRKKPPERQPTGMLFHSEDALEHFVIHNFERIGQFSGLKMVKNQYTLANHRKVDILARDRLNGDYVVIELKRNDADDRILAQMEIYMSEVEKQAAKEGVGVRGIIITGQKNTYLHEIIKAWEKPVSWLVYKTAFAVETQE